MEVSVPQSTLPHYSDFGGFEQGCCPVDHLQFGEEYFKVCKVTWRQRLLQFVSFFFVLNDKGVKVTTASHLELHSIFDLLYLDSCNKINSIGAI